MSGPNDRITDMIGKDGFLGRRWFLEVAAGALATTQLAPLQVANAGRVPDGAIQLAQSDGAGSFLSLKQISAGVLDVAYVEAGPIDGPAGVPFVCGASRDTHLC